MTTVTVTIPTKNERATIGQTLHALNAQTRTPDRVLIADDSDDGTAYFSRVTAFKHDYELEVFSIDEPGVGAAREAMRERTEPGLLVCLDAQVEIESDWLAEHIAIHDEHDGQAVVSGTWPGSRVDGTTVIDDAADPAYFVEANCSMPTAAAEKIGGWDPTFRRGCDWDFRIRLSGTPGVDAIASDRVGAKPMSSNQGGIIHIRKQFNRPSSIPYLRKYGENYAFFHPAHIIGDAAGVTAVAALCLSPFYPSAIAWVAATAAAYAVRNDRHGYTLSDRVLSGLVILPVGYSTLRAVING